MLHMTRIFRKTPQQKKAELTKQREKEELEKIQAQQKQIDTIEKAKIKAQEKELIEQEKKEKKELDAFERAETFLRNDIMVTLEAINQIITTLRATLVDPTDSKISIATNPAIAGQSLFQQLAEKDKYFTNIIRIFNERSELPDTNPFFIEELNKAVRAFRRETEKSLDYFTGITEKLTTTPITLYGFKADDFHAALGPLIKTAKGVSRLLVEELNPDEVCTLPGSTHPMWRQPTPVNGSHKSPATSAPTPQQNKMR